MGGGLVGGCRGQRPRLALVQMLNGALQELVNILFPATTIIEPPWTQDWGSWGSWSKCPGGHYVEAVRVKVENYQGTFYDDSALNGIRLKCSDGQELSSREGPDGQWSSWTSSSHGLTAADMRSEPRDSWAAA